MKDFPIRFVLTDEAITPSAGLALVGYLLPSIKFVSKNKKDNSALPKR